MVKGGVIPMQESEKSERQLWSKPKINEIDIKMTADKGGIPNYGSGNDEKNVGGNPD